MKDNVLTSGLKRAIGLHPPATQHNDPSSQHGMLHFHSSKVPNLANAKAGDAVTMHAHGTIHAVDPNGNMVMHVHDVKPDSQAMEKTQHPEQKVPVRGVESRSS